MPEFAPQQIIFARRLERQLLETKSQAAKKVIDSTINQLERAALDETSDVAHIYDTLNSSKASRAEKKYAKQALKSHIAGAKSRAIKDHQLALDRVALGLNENANVDASLFNGFWDTLNLTYKPIIKPRHHSEVLDAINEHFKQKEALDGTDVNTLNNEYHAARAQYYQMLEDQHKANKKWRDLNAKELSYELGYEKRRIQNDIANKETDQSLLKWGLRMAKVFAFAQAVFVAGGTILLMNALAPLMGLPLLAMQIIGPVFAGILFLAVARSNWLTINEEMGPLLKELFFDPALAHLSYWKRTKLWLRRSEISRKSALNTAKGFTNIVAGAFLGVLTLMGGMSMFGFIPGLALFGGQASLGVFGTAALWVIGVLALLSLVTKFVYFVINNINQKDKNEGGAQEAIDLKRHEQLRTIANTSKWEFWKQYSVNIVIGLTGVAFTLAAASSNIFSALSPAFGSLNTGHFFGFLGSAFNGIPLAGVITAAIFAIAWYGISSFYQARTRGATERLIGKEVGLVFDELKGSHLRNMDVTGIPPDFGHEERMRNRSIFTQAFDFLTYPLFNMTRDNSEQARWVNALGQGMPAFMGAWTLSTLGFVFVGLAWAPVITPIAALLALPVGVIFGTAFASFASWSANSAGMRVVKDAVTELNTLKADQLVLQSAAVENDNIAELGADKADIEFYKASRARNADFYGLAPLSSYTKDAKIEGASRLVANMDEYVSTGTVPVIDSRDTPEKQTSKMINFLYDKPGAIKLRGFNPLAQKDSDLGELATKASDHIRADRCRTV